MLACLLSVHRARSVPRFAGGAFDFISVCPPYLLVSYPELFKLLEGSPLLHDGTIMFVEYPRQLASQIPDTLGSLSKVSTSQECVTCVRPGIYCGTAVLGDQGVHEV
eukprot:131473-Pelagomonas_calceolata.AAC.2